MSLGLNLFAMRCCRDDAIAPVCAQTPKSQGLTDLGILQAAGFPLWLEPLDDDLPQRELRLGFDDSGRLLELVVLIFLAEMNW